MLFRLVNRALMIPVLCANFAIIEPVAKPLVLQLAGGAKLRPTEDRLVRRGTKAANAALELSPHLAGLIGFGATPYESINCRKLAEDGENEDEYSIKPNSELKDQTANKVGVEALRIRSVSAGYQERSGAALLRGQDDILARLKKDVTALASPKMAGRGNGQEGLEKAVDYVVDSYKKLKLTPQIQRFPFNYTNSPNKDPDGYLKNVIVTIEGSDPKLKSQHIIIGAHLDHLGSRPSLGPINRAHLDHLGSRRLDSKRQGTTHPPIIFPGADDNASGTAALMELARYYHENPPVRTLLFIHFTGEEWGLLGSKHWVANPTVNIKSVRFMLNLDMIGRLGHDGDTLAFTAMGMGSDAIAKAKAMAPAGINIEADRGTSIFAAASDHAPFAANNIPTCFLFTGMHPDYHRPTDTADKINWVGLATITQYAQTLITEYAIRGDVPEFKPRADLGMILNLGENASVWRVLVGGSAESAGMMQGDILTFVDDHMVDSPNGLERILDLFSRGDTIKLKWKRGEKQMEAHVVLQ